MKRLVHLFGPLLVICIFVGAMWMLYHELHQYHYRDIRRGLSEISAPRIWLAAALTALNYIVLMWYDLLAVRSVGHPLPFRKIALASFIGYAASYNFGALLGGTSVRYRLYSAWGLSAVEIVRVLSVLALTFWIGLFALAGVVFLWQPLTLPPDLHLPFTSIRFLGILLLLLTAAYLSVSALRKRPFRVREWEFAVPSLPMSLSQIAVASADLLVATAVLYVLLPPSLGINYLYFLGIYLLAIVAVLFTHVPGGLGVFELVILLMLSPAARNLVVGSLLAFRAIYYLGPLLVGAVLLAGSELAINRHFLRRILQPAGQLAPMVAPRLFSMLVFLAGVILLVSGVLPAEPTRLGWLRRVLPLPVLELSHFFGSVLGVLLLLLSRGLQRRLDSAWLLALILLACGSLLSILKGLDYEEATTLAVMFLLLAVCRRDFYRHGSLFRQPLSLGWITAAAVVVLCSIWIGLFAHKHVEYQNDLWWHFSFRGDVPRFLRASVGAVVALLLVAGAWLLRPASPRPSLPDRPQLEAAARIAATSRATYANLAMAGDKILLMDGDRKAFLMYGVAGRTWVAMGDPVGPQAARTELVWRFRDLADRYDARTAFYQVEPELLPVYLDVGLSFLKLGEEARVALPDFSLEGSDRKSLRQSVRRCQREECILEVVPAAEVPGIFPELQRVSDEWLAEKHVLEKGFSMGRFDADYLARFPAAVVRRQGEVVAFANVWCGAEQTELSVDLMRFAADAPPGVMDYLFSELMLWGRERGYRQFNLGVAPLSGLESRSLSPLWNRVGAMIFRHGEHFDNFHGLRQYKEKFLPEWRPKYLASPGGFALPQTLAAIAALISRNRTDDH